MSDQKQIQRKGNGKLPAVLSTFAICSSILLLVSWILILVQRDPAGLQSKIIANNGDVNYQDALIIAGVIVNAVAFTSFIIILLCAFKMNHTAVGKYDEQIWKYALVGFLLSALSLVFLAIMTAGVVAYADQTVNQYRAGTATNAYTYTGIANVISSKYGLFTSFFTLFTAGGTIFVMLAAIITIRHSYSVKVEVKVNKTADSLAK